MRILIIGGTGHISGSLSRQLLAMGHSVSCFHRNHSNTLDPEIEQILGDRQDRASFEAEIQARSFDIAIDMIAFNLADAESSHRACKQVQHFLHCSTVCTYGLPQDRFPIAETRTCTPISDYGKNKLAADNYLLTAHKNEGFPVTIVKPSTTYGPKMGLLRQIAWDFTWINRIRAGKGLVHCADGMALHQFMYVDDCARAIALLAGLQASIGEIINIVPDRCWSWQEHARTAMQVLKQEVPLHSASYAQLKQAGIPEFGICEDIFRHHTYYSSAKLQSLLPQFTCEIDLATGMQQTIAGMEAAGRLPDAAENAWEDALINRL